VVGLMAARRAECKDQKPTEISWIPFARCLAPPNCVTWVLAPIVTVAVPAMSELVPSLVSKVPSSMVRVSRCARCECRYAVEAVA